MSGIASGIGHLVQSFFEIIQGIASTIVSGISAAISFIIGLFQQAINVVIGLIKNAFNLAEGALGFIIGNIFIIGTIAAVYYGYVLYQQRQGKQVSITTKKRN